MNGETRANATPGPTPSRTASRTASQTTPVVAPADEAVRAGRIVTIRDGACATIVIDAPRKRNSVDASMLEALAHGADTLRVDETVALVVLRGAGGKAFCAGADLDAMCTPPLQDSVDRLDRALSDAVAALHAIPVPVVALVEGACIGGGVQLALCADTIVARDDATFGIPAVQAGMAYPLGALRTLVARVGAPAAKDFLLFGRRWDAQAAVLHGLVQRHGDAAAIEAHLAAMLTCVTQSPRAAVLAYKAILNALSAEAGSNGVAGVAGESDVAAAETAHRLHRAFADERTYLPKLRQFAASRKAEAPR